MSDLNLTFISDTHNRHEDIDVGSGHILLHSGDATGMGSYHEIEKFANWFHKQDYDHLVFTPGNHDWGFEKEPTRYRDLFDKLNIHLLIDDTITIEGIKIHGSPMTPWFCDWAFNRARNGAEAAMHKCDYIFPHWDMIPDDTDILLTHGPPYEILDELCLVDGTPKGQFVGCEDLLKRVKEVKPKIHAFGHIHCGYGIKKVDETLFINASSLDECYSPGEKPIHITYGDNKLVHENIQY